MGKRTNSLQAAVKGFVVFILIFQLSAAVTFAGKEAATHDQAILALQSFGLLEGENLQSESNVTRAEFVKLLIKALGFPDAPGWTDGTTRFLDVELNSAYIGYINLAVSRGITKGFAGGFFAPDEAVTYEQAVKMTVAALGYDLFAAERGGYPAGYLLTAFELGITKGTAPHADNPVHLGTAAQLVFNALEAKLAEYNTAGYIVTNKTLLTDALQIEKGKGMVTANYFYRVIGETPRNEDEAAIDNIAYRTGKTNAKELVGSTVEYYFTRDETTNSKILLYLRPVGRGYEIISVLSEDIIGEDSRFSKERFVYQDGDHKRAVDIEADYVVLNGETVPITAGILRMDGAEGEITLIDSDNNGYYDIIHAAQYETMVVDSVNSTGKIVHTKYGKPVLNIDPHKDNRKIRIMHNNTKLAPSDLREWDVLSIETSASQQTVIVHVTRSAVSGEITELVNGRESVTIAGGQYGLSAQYTQTIQVGDSGTFYLNKNGLIAAFDKTAERGARYAYIMGYKENNGLGGMQFKLFTENGRALVVSAAKRFTIDNGGVETTYDDSQSAQINTALAAIFSHRNPDDPAYKDNFNPLIKYELSQTDELRKIIIPKRNVTTLGEEFQRDDEVFSLDYKAQGMRHESNSFAGLFWIDAGTKVFTVPDYLNEKEDESRYSVGHPFAHAGKYVMDFYDLNDDHVAKAVLVHLVQPEKEADLVEMRYFSMAIIKRISTAISGEGTEMNRITWLYNGAESTVEVEKTFSVVQWNGGATAKIPVEALKKGDIVSPFMGPNNRLIYLEQQYQQGTGAVRGPGILASEMSFQYGMVTKTTSGSMLVDGAPVRTAGARVYVIDLLRNDYIATGNVSDIQPGDFVYFRRNWTKALEIIAVKKD